MRPAFLGAILASVPVLWAQAPLTIDLTGALERARTVYPSLQAAANATALAHEDRLQAKAQLLPNLNVLNGYTYTQDNGTSSGVFVANNGIHVYDEQAVVHAEVFSLAKNAEYRRAIAAEATARARQDVARRGLAGVVIQSYYAVVSAQRRIINATRSLEEAQRFEDLTRRQEQGGEVAHADVVKAQLQTRRRQRELQDSQANTEKAKLNLAVVIFPNLDQPFAVVDDLQANAAVSATNEIRQQAFTNNPDVRTAELTVDQARYAKKAAQGEYYPSLIIDYFYGMDANNFARRNYLGTSNLGSVVAATVTVPVWNWGSTRSKVRQSEIQQRQAELDLSFTRRQVEANVTAYSLEAQAARAQLDLLRSTVDLADESLRLTVVRYQAGEATTLEVVDAQTTAADARNGYDDGLARYRLALANIEALTGRY